MKKRRKLKIIKKEQLKNEIEELKKKDKRWDILIKAMELLFRPYNGDIIPINFKDLEPRRIYERSSKEKEEKL